MSSEGEVREESGSHRRPPDEDRGSIRLELKHIVLVVGILAGGSLGGGGISLLRSGAPAEVTARLEVIAKSVDEMNVKLTRIEDHQASDTRDHDAVAARVAQLEERVRLLEIKTGHP